MSDDDGSLLNVATKVVQFRSHLTGARAMFDGFCQFNGACVVFKDGTANSRTFMNNWVAIGMDFLE